MSERPKNNMWYDTVIIKNMWCKVHGNCDVKHLYKDKRIKNLFTQIIIQAKVHVKVNFSKNLRKYPKDWTYLFRSDSKEIKRLKTTIDRCEID